MATDRIRIQAALKAEAILGPWSLVRYPKGVATIDNNTKVEPDSVLVNETSAFFEEAERNRRDPRFRQRGAWNFQLIVAFNEGEVSCEEFEDRIRQGGVLIPADKSKGEGQITLEMEGAEYDHPPQKDPQSGTRVTYTFQARQAPR